MKKRLVRILQLITTSKPMPPKSIYLNQTFPLKEELERYQQEEELREESFQQQKEPLKIKSYHKTVK